MTLKLDNIIKAVVAAPQPTADGKREAEYANQVESIRRFRREKAGIETAIVNRKANILRMLDEDVAAGGLTEALKTKHTNDLEDL